MSPVRDATATKEKIIKAAFGEFTKRGFAGARVEEIATKAKVNKALLYHYYADKEALFKNVLECKMAELGALQIDPDRFAACAGDFFDFYAANPWLARLLQWEALDFGDRPVPNEDERRAHLQRHVTQIARAQSEGIVDASLDASQTLFTLISIVHYWFAAPQTARMITGGNPYTPQALKRRRAHVVDVARRILEVR